METPKSRSNGNQIAVIQKPIVIPFFILEFQFPIELWLPIALNNQQGLSIVSVNSTRDENKVMSTLSRTCHFFHTRYQTELEKRAVKKLLECFFLPTKENVEKAMKMLTAHPKLAYVKIENDKTITDLRRRGFEGSLLQAAMQTKAVGWLNWLKKEVVEKTNTQDLAIAQYQEKFGEPDARKDRMLAQLDSDLKAIEAAFANDLCTNYKPTLQATREAFDAMRQHLQEENMPGITIKKGEFFPIEIMQKIYEVYCKHWNDDSWDNNRLCCYSTFVIGFAPRFFAADDFLRVWRGLANEPTETVPFYGDFKQTFKFNNRTYELDFTQLDKYADFRLGDDFFVDCLDGGLAVGLAGRTASFWKSCVEQKLQACRTYAATPKSEIMVHDCLKKRNEVDLEPQHNVLLVRANKHQ